MLTQLLHNEAITTTIEGQLISERKLKQSQRKKNRQVHSRLFKLHDEYTAGQKSTSQLLKACSEVIPIQSA